MICQRGDTDSDVVEQLDSGATASGDDERTDEGIAVDADDHLETRVDLLLHQERAGGVGYARLGKGGADGRNSIARLDRDSRRHRAFLRKRVHGVPDDGFGMLARLVFDRRLDCTPCDKFLLRDDDQNFEPALCLGGPARGEAQRIRLAAQLGSNLQGVCYVLDEPTIGLHPRDNQILLSALARLSAKGNTLVVVEHDEDTIRRADHIIDIGPGAGRRGGRLVAQGDVAALSAQASSVTGRFLAHPLRHPLQARRLVSAQAPALRLLGASLHNLRHVDVVIPLQRLVAVTGVSGSGKSTLARDVLLANLRTVVGQRPGKAPAWHGCRGIEGWQGIDRVLEVDQTPIGKTPRSCPATYIGFWDTIRKLFTETLEAKARGYAAARFSFNTGDGRCPGCEGQGMRTIEMSFLPDVKVPCDQCHGARFNAETLAVSWRGKSIGDVLRMEVDEAVGFFASMPSIAHPLQLLQDVGLGYLS